MKTIKRDNLSLITRTYIHRGAPLLLVAAMAGFSLTRPDAILTEDELWEAVEASLGNNDYIDQGFPRPTGEVILRARCYPPGGQDGTGCPVTFQVGSLEKTLIVFGDRRWNSVAGIYTGISDPLPFTVMDISWQNAFGGPGSPLNPRGKGLVKLTDHSGKSYLPLPNIEDPTDLVCVPAKSYNPRGFDYGGPEYIGRESERFMGTYNDDWLIHHWPHLPDDFDLRAAYAAPGDQRLKEGFFRGDENLLLKNMHPTLPRIAASLPGRRVRIFTRSVKFDLPVFEEHTADLDKIWLFPHLEAGVLIWHTMIAVGNEEADDVSHLLAFVERLDETPKPVTWYTAMCEEETTAAPPPATSGAPVSVEISSPPEVPSSKIVTAATIAAAATIAIGGTADAAEKIDVPSFAYAQSFFKEWEEKLAAQEAELDKLLKDGGIEIPPPAAVEKPELPERHTALSLEESLNRQESQLAAAEEKLRQSLAEAGIDPDQLPPLPETTPAKSPEEIISALQGAGLEHTELFGIVAAAAATLAALEKEKADFEAALKTEITGKRGQAEITPPEAEKPPPPGKTVLTRNEVMSRYNAGENLSCLDLTGIDLSGCRLPGARFRETILEEANLAGADLTGADFTGAILTRADCSGAMLKKAILCGVTAGGLQARETDFTEVDMTEVDLAGADLSGASLMGVRLGEANLERTSLRECRAEGASGASVNFSGADLTGARMSRSRLPRADLSNTRLDEANFMKADLTGASFHNAAGEGANFSGAKLPESRSNGGTSFGKADFQEADLTAASWQDSSFSECLFIRACLDRALFMGCRLRGSNFYRAVAREARFDEADLTRASMVAVNLFQGSLRKAVLNHSDFEGSNLYAVDFYKAVFRETDLQGTNLKRTFFADWTPLRL